MTFDNTETDMSKYIRDNMTPMSMRAGFQAALCVSPIVLLLNSNLAGRDMGKDNLVVVSLPKSQRLHF